MSKVEWKTLGDVVDYIRGVTYSKQDEVYFPDNEPVYRVLRSNNITIKSNTLNFSDLKYISQRVKIKKNQILSKGDILICAGNGSTEHIGKVAFINESIDYTFGGFMGVIRCKDSAYSKYLYYILCSTVFKNFLRKNFNGGAINNLNADLLYKFRFPLTDLFAIKQIVSQLDTFTTLIAKLESELTLRQKQYEFYREELLNFDGDEEVEWKKLGDYISLQRGKRVVKSDLSEENSIPVYQNSLKPLGYYNQTNRKKQTTFIICAGAAGEVGFSNCDFWAADDCFTVKCINEVTNKYIYYLLINEQNKIKTMVRKAGVPRLSPDSILQLAVLIPTVQIQQQIVSQLDTFEQLIAALKREIALRQKQYEFYREKLLTFE